MGYLHLAYKCSDVPWLVLYVVLPQNKHYQKKKKIGQSKVHNSWFVESEWCFECGLPPVFLFNLNVVVTPVDVELGEKCFALQVVQNVAD